MSTVRYCDSPFFFRRRRSREVIVGDPARGGVIIGGEHPVVMQSMITCDTMDTAECVKQTLDLVKVGCEIVRITAPTVKDAANLRISWPTCGRGAAGADRGGHPFQTGGCAGGCQVGRMVRVNPGNYADTKKFAVKDTPMSSMRRSWPASRRSSPRW